MANRLAALSLYAVPKGLEGRKEATFYMTPDGEFRKQDLILEVVDLTHPQRSHFLILLMVLVS